jgi:hypothetical protein
MRYTIVDERGAVSLIGPCHALKMLVAACARMPATLGDLLDHVRTLDEQFAAFVGNGLAVFDEHHRPDAEAAPRLGTDAPAAVFRVTGPATRQASLQPHGAGVVIFNLPRRRIVQVHNTYAEVSRQDRGRVRRDGRPVPAYYSYDLPGEWQIVP